MNCNFMLSCNCNNCQNFVKTTSVAIVNNTLQLTIPDRVLRNCECLCINVAQNIPSNITSGMPIKIVVNGTIYNVVTSCCCNFIYADQIRTGKTYCFKFGIDTNTFIHKGGWRLCRTAHDFTPVLSITTKVKKVETASKEVDKDKK